MSATSLRGEDRELLPAAHGGRAALDRVLVVDLPVGPALQHLVEGDAALEPRQRGAEAEVQPVPEAQVVADLAVDVEASRRRGTGGRRGSPSPLRSSMTLPSGTVWPWCSTSRVT